jgi:hypothetical protein
MSTLLSSPPSFSFQTNPPALYQSPSFFLSTKPSASFKNSRPTKSTSTRLSSTSFSSLKPVRHPRLHSFLSTLLMRSPYSLELQALPSTMEAATEVPQGGLRALRRGAFSPPLFSRPLICIDLHVSRRTSTSPRCRCLVRRFVVPSRSRSAFSSLFFPPATTANAPSAPPAGSVSCSSPRMWPVKRYCRAVAVVSSS